MKNILIVAFIFLSSCSTSKSIDKTVTNSMDSWMGSTKQNLIMQLGPPTKTDSDGSSGQILIYANRIYVPPMGYNPAIDVWQYKMFYVNNSNVIYHWLYKRNPNPPERVDVRILTN